MFYKYEDFLEKKYLVAENRPYIWNDDEVGLKMFERDDWNQYVKQYLDVEYLGRLCDAWELTEEERENLFKRNIVGYGKDLNDFDRAKSIEENHEMYLNPNFGEPSFIERETMAIIKREAKKGELAFHEVKLWDYWKKALRK